MNVKHFVDELIKSVPAARRDPMLELCKKIKAIVEEAPEELRVPALQLVALGLLDDDDHAPADGEVDPEAITAVEPAITEEEP